MDGILVIPAYFCSDASVGNFLDMVLLLELLLVFSLLFLWLHKLVFLASLAPLAGSNRLFIVGGVAILTHVIIGVDTGFLLLRNHLGHMRLFETPTEKWYIGVELAVLHVSVIGFALLATLARTGLLFGADEHFFDWFRLEVEDVMEQTVSWNHHL
jgi:hypothetical protein